MRTGGIIHEAGLITEAERTGEVSGELTKPWLAPVGRAVAAGTLSLDAAEAIRVGLEHFAKNGSPARPTAPAHAITHPTAQRPTARAGRRVPARFLRSQMQL